VSTAGRDVRVCFVGDSFVAGLGDSTGLGWVGRVHNESHRRGLPLTTYNLGVRQDTSLLICERLAREVAPRLAHAEVPRIVVSFGVNDTAFENGTTRVTRKESLTALRSMSTAIGSIDLMLIGPPAVDDDDQNERISALSDALREESNRLGIPFVGCFESTMANSIWRRQIREGDGFHPDKAGYEQLAAIIQAPLLDWLSPHAIGASLN
jgi:acyl-CoA thioesterase I